MVELKTTKGTIKIALWPDKAPETVRNFLRYVDEGFYNGTIFHRVIDGFMVQGGGFAADMTQKSAHEPIRNEARSDAGNELGTIAMARTSDVHSASAQFFINVKNNTFLNHKDDTEQGFGYCVFGEVAEGWDVVEQIKSVPTTTRSGYTDVPAEPVVIESAGRVETE